MMKELPRYMGEFLKFREIESLTEPQERALPYIIDSETGSNMVVAAPTGSGKTLIGEMAIVETALVQKRKAAYLVPLKSLAKEKYDELQSYESKYGLKVTIRTSDYESDENDITKFDLIVSTYEKWDSMTRRCPTWTSEIGAVVIDEAHMVTDSSRGPTLECLLTRMRVKFPHIRLVLLSAVMPNVQDIATWIGAIPILSHWRAVPLKRGVYVSSGQVLKHHCGSNSMRLNPNCEAAGCGYAQGGKIVFEDGSERVITVPQVKAIIPSLCMDILREGGQALVFAKSRKESIRLAKEIGASVSFLYLSQNQKDALKGFIDLKWKSLGDRYENETNTLLGSLRNGTAYHNAGLGLKLRQIVEEGFKQTLIKVVVATPTLAQGVNLPARRVIIQSIHRMTRDGIEEIPRWETENQMGRAGRRAFDKYGEAVLVDDGSDPQPSRAVGVTAGEDPLLAYIKKPIEKIESKLFTRTNLLSHMLAEVAYTRGGVDRKYIRQFFSGSFGAKSGQINESISSRVMEDSIEFLKKNLLSDMKGGSMTPTALGIKLCQMYVNPTNMENILFALRTAEQKVKNHESLSAVGWIHLACSSVEFSNLRPVYQGVSPLSPKSLLLDATALLYDQAMEYANVISDHIEEQPKSLFAEKFKLSYTDVGEALEHADWLLSTIVALSEILKCSKEVLKSLQETLLRVQKGVKADLLSLVTLKGVARITARRLYKGGIKSREDFLLPGNFLRIGEILGNGRAEMILRKNGADV